MELRKVRRAALRAMLRPILRWQPLREPRDGWSIVLGTPWALRHLLDVNLLFVERTDLTGLDAIRVVFDRTKRPGADRFVEELKLRHPGLPLSFQFHEALPGRLVQRINQSKFYASMNWVTGIKACRSRYAIMHDFDLYPLDRTYFRQIVDAMSANSWRFAGAELTHFSGLTDADCIIGTWNLGVDVAWMRSNWAPVDCFHSVAQLNGRRVDFDAFSEIQSRTPARGLVTGLGLHSFAHVRNLCSTYLRFRKGEAPNVVWRLHFLWYLESLSGSPGHFEEAIAAMRAARSSILKVADYSFDFSRVHHTCSNVLRDELAMMESSLFGGVREQVSDYVAAFADFLERFGDKRPVEELRAAWAAGLV